MIGPHQVIPFCSCKPSEPTEGTSGELRNEDHGNADRKQGIATSVSNFMLLVLASLFGPILPAVSSLQSGRTPEQLGEIVIKTTRYFMMFLCLIGLPLLIGPYPLLKLWVGHDYAIRSALFLQVLVLGNVIRQLAYPYALVVLATGNQHLAAVTAVAEALVNVSLSIYLVQRFGAVGVAFGTLAGAFVSIGLHFAVSMNLTRPTISMSRRRFVSSGLLRPLLSVIPTMLLIAFWKEWGSDVRPPGSPSMYLDTGVGQSHESTNPKQSLVRCLLARPV